MLSQIILKDLAKISGCKQTINLDKFKLPGRNLLWPWLLLRRPVRKWWRSKNWKIPFMHPTCFCSSWFSSFELVYKRFADICTSSSTYASHTYPASTLLKIPSPRMQQDSWCIDFQNLRVLESMVLSYIYTDRSLASTRKRISSLVEVVFLQLLGGRQKQYCTKASFFIQSSALQRKFMSVFFLLELLIFFWSFREFSGKRESSG